MESDVAGEEREHVAPLMRYLLVHGYDSEGQGSVQNHG
jgi:hypothetical protein